jgi:predicted nuclease of predicted toxin-antitoxin system
LRLLADENFPGHAVDALQRAGHDVLWIRTEAPGLFDRDVLALAASEGRVLATFDKDFGELVFRLHLPQPPGVILFRISPVSPAYVAQTAVTVIASRDDWSGHFAVIEEDRVRMVPLPPLNPGTRP